MQKTSMIDFASSEKGCLTDSMQKTSMIDLNSYEKVASLAARTHSIHKGTSKFLLTLTGGSKQGIFPLLNPTFIRVSQVLVVM
jgi:hypothetical protein